MKFFFLIHLFIVIIFFSGCQTIKKKSDEIVEKENAKLRDYKTNNNLLLLKTEMKAGHGGKSGRDGAIEEIAIDYAFVLKITKKLKYT